MKRKPRARPSLVASALSFDFVAPLPLGVCANQLKKMTVTQPPSDIAFFKLDGELQRFYLKTRSLRSPLIEARGMLQRSGEDQTLVSGEIFGEVLFMPLIIAFLIGVIVIVMVTLNFWLLLLGLIATGILLIYWRTVAARTAADQAQLAQLIREALMPDSDEDAATEP